MHFTSPTWPRAVLGFSLRVSLGLSLLVGPGCRGGQEGGADSLGSWGESEALGIVPIDEFIAVFPPFEGPPVLGRSSHLKVLADEILVGESLDARIHRFDLEGAWLGTFGRKGQGPGEFRSISEIQPAGDGTLWVGDPRNARWTRLELEGTVRHERPADPLARSFFPFPDGSFLVPVPGAPGSVARVHDPVDLPSQMEPVEGVRSMEAMAGWLMSAGVSTSLVVSAGDAWVLARDTVFRVPGVEARPPELGVALSGTPVFTLPEAWVAERRTRMSRSFGASAVATFLSGLGSWQGRGIVVVTTTPAGTVGYLLEATEAEERGIRILRLEAGGSGGLARGLRDLHLRGDTLFAITGTDVRMFRVELP